MYKLYIFDLDGTLLNTRECILKSFTYALQRNGVKLVKKNDQEQKIRTSLSNVLTKISERRADRTFYMDLAESYCYFYKKLIFKEAKIYHGIPDLLNRLKNNSALIALATNKRTEFAKFTLDAFNLTQIFDYIVGQDMVNNKKPHPEMVNNILTTLNIKPENAVLVGDSMLDIEMGQNAGIYTCGVSWGLYSISKLKKSRPSVIVEKPRQIFYI